VAYHALKAEAMHAVDASDGCPVTKSKSEPCLQAAAFSGGGWLVWAVMNICQQAVPTTLGDPGVRGGTASGHEITTYAMSDPGGWSSLPTDPDDLPWSSGPLKPTHISVDGPMPAQWAAPALSFSIVLIKQ
jgi:hypothetical protein